MTKKMKWNFLLIILVISMSVYFIVTKGFNRGLDIAGGSQFTIEIATEGLNDETKQDVIEKVLEIYRNRVNEIGVEGTIVQQSGDNQIIVQIPGIETEQSERIKDILKRQARLEFRLVVKGPEDFNS